MPETPPANGDASGVMPQREAAAIPQLDDLAKTTLERTRIPGMAIAVVYADESPYLKGFGTRKAGRDAPVEPDTVFQLASRTKLESSRLFAVRMARTLRRWAMQT